MLEERLLSDFYVYFGSEALASPKWFILNDKILCLYTGLKSRFRIILEVGFYLILIVPPILFKNYFINKFL
jgi:hypothetical protein